MMQSLITITILFSYSIINFFSNSLNEFEIENIPSPNWSNANSYDQSITLGAFSLSVS